MNQTSERKSVWAHLCANNKSEPNKLKERKHLIKKTNSYKDMINLK